jgi:hypothetical protein
MYQCSASPSANCLFCSAMRFQRPVTTASESAVRQAAATQVLSRRRRGDFECARAATMSPAFAHSRRHQRKDVCIPRRLPREVREPGEQQQTEHAPAPPQQEPENARGRQRPQSELRKHVGVLQGRRGMFHHELNRLLKLADVHGIKILLDRELAIEREREHHSFFEVRADETGDEHQRPRPHNPPRRRLARLRFEPPLPLREFAHHDVGDITRPHDQPQHEQRMAVHPDQLNGRQPPDQPRPFFDVKPDVQPQREKQLRQHLRALVAATRNGDDGRNPEQDLQPRRHAAPGRRIGNPNRGGDDRRLHENHEIRPAQPVNRRNEHLEAPVHVDPRLVEIGERVPVFLRPGAEDPSFPKKLSRFQVPPEIGVVEREAEGEKCPKQQQDCQQHISSGTHRGRGSRRCGERFTAGRLRRLLRHAALYRVECRSRIQAGDSAHWRAAGLSWPIHWSAMSAREAAPTFEPGG